MRTSTSVVIGGLGLLAVGCAGAHARAPATAIQGASASETATLAHGTDAVCRWVHRGAGGNVADTRVAERWPDRSYGNETVAFAGRVGGAARYVLLDFDIRAVLPAGAVVRSATLVVTALSSSGPSRVSAHRITTPWNESTTTWDSFSSGFDAYEEASLRTATGTVAAASFDITRLVRAWHAGEQQQLGVALRQHDGNTRFATSEAESMAARPRLEICFAATGSAT